jgi:hypothetical protein
MYTRPATPLPIGGVIDDAIKLYRASFRESWKVSLLGSIAITACTVYLLWSVLGAAVGIGAVGANPNPVDALRWAGTFFGTAFKAYILISLLTIVVYTAIFLQINEIGQGRSGMTLGALLGASIRRLPGALVSSIVVGVAIVIGMILLLIPGVFLWGKLQFWFASMAADDCGAIEGLGRSWSATVNNWWRSAIIMTVAVILLVVLQLVVSLVSGAMMGMFAVGSLAKGSLSFLILPELIRLVTYVFILPALPAVQLATYYDLSLRRGGGDLTARAESLKPA